MAALYIRAALTLRGQEYETQRKSRTELRTVVSALETLAERKNSD
jgi:hypothetical protein